MDFTEEDRESRLDDQRSKSEWHRFVEGNLILKKGMVDKKKGLFPRRWVKFPRNSSELRNFKKLNISKLTSLRVIPRGVWLSLISYSNSNSIPRIDVCCCSRRVLTYTTWILRKWCGKAKSPGRQHWILNQKISRHSSSIRWGSCWTSSWLGESKNNLTSLLLHFTGESIAFNG